MAELSCLHNQHVRHHPPFQERAWVLSEPGRSARAGTSIECPLCDRLELPADLELVRTAGPDTAPAARLRLRAGDELAIPPAVRHRADVDVPVRLVIEFFVKARVV